MKQREETQIAKTALTEQLHGSGTSLLRKYQDKVVGDSRILSLLEYEIATLLFSGTSGALGFLLRKWFYRRLFKSMGRGVILGKGMVVRHPGRITIGDRVAIDDYVMLDAWGAGEDGLTLGEDVIVARNCVIQAKLGPIMIGPRSDIGCNTVLSSVSGIYLGQSVLIAGNCYIGGGRYRTERLDIPIMDQGLYSRGPVTIGDGVWLGAAATVIDGVAVGEGSIVGAGALVTKDVPAYAIVAGVPARVVGTRDGSVSALENDSYQESLRG